MTVMMTPGLSLLDLAKEMEALGDANLKSANFLNDGYTIPTNDTTYYDKCLGGSEFTEKFGAETAHIVGIQHVIDERSEHMVHHFVLQAFTDRNCENRGKGRGCRERKGRKEENK